MWPFFRVRKERKDVLKNVQGKYEEIIPSEVFTKDRSIGLRDVGLNIVQLLQQNTKVVVVDGNETKKARQSYINLVKKKCKNKTVLVLDIRPKYGCLQLFWSREYKLAEIAQSSTTSDYHLHITDTQILKWFQNESDKEICCRPGIVDAVTEGDTQSHIVDLCVETFYKWEVPALFVQWELIVNNEDQNVQTSKITDILYKWSEANPYGRIIVICDGKSIGTGEKTKHQEISDIKNTILEISKNFTSNAVFVYHVDDPYLAGSFVQPPKPGILAYLQHRHYLNLHSKNTVYLHATTDHMRMAESAGVRFIKGSKVMRNPGLVTSHTAATIPPIPDMLKSLRLRPPDNVSVDVPTIPLIDRRSNYQDGFVSLHVGKGRTEYAFMKTWEIFQKLQENYTKAASKLGEKDSIISPEKSIQSVESSPLSSVNNQSKSGNMSRDMPKWMMGREQSSRSLRSSVGSSCGSGADGDKDKSARKTLYMMTDLELTETAIEILKQAGKTEIINNFKSKLQKVPNMVSGNEEKCVKEENVSFTNTNQRTTGRKRKINSGTSSSVCPKMEPVSYIPSLSDKFLSEHRQMATKQDLDENNFSEESFDGPSTESSGDERESVDIESDKEDLIINEQVNQVKLVEKLKDQSRSDNPERESSSSKIFNNVPCDATRTKCINSRKHRAPDLSILDEIFN